MPSTKHELPMVVQNDNVLVDARLLHRQLRVGKDFSTWFKDRIKEYHFQEQTDFIAHQIGGAIKSNMKVAHNRIDYLLTVDMAKELAMLERNEVGRAIRRFFIAKEKELRGISQLPKEVGLFKGIKARRINDREMYPYREILERAGYSRKANSERKNRYWMHFVKDGNILYITKELALHLHHQKQVYNNRAVMLASQPVLPFNFGEPLLLTKTNAK
jgi:anti-repressor protein